MNTAVYVGTDAELDECLRFNLDERRAQQVVVIAHQTGFSVTWLLGMILRTRPVPIPPWRELNPNDYFPRDPQPLNRREQRDRSMKKPTGKPWDSRRRRR